MSNFPPTTAVGTSEPVAREMRARRVVSAMRSEFERRRRYEAALLAEYERMLVDLDDQAFRQPWSDLKKSAPTRGNRSGSFAAIVRAVVHLYGNAPFTLDDLACALAARHPDCKFTRPLLSRRLSDMCQSGDVPELFDRGIPYIAKTQNLKPE